MSELFKKVVQVLVVLLAGVILGVLSQVAGFDVKARVCGNDYIVARL